eukprot:SAG31_NODE_44743_length_261_cov_0.981481_1_plen_56_part_10
MFGTKTLPPTFCGMPAGTNGGASTDIVVVAPANMSSVLAFFIDGDLEGDSESESSS